MSDEKHPAEAGARGIFASIFRKLGLQPSEDVRREKIIAEMAGNAIVACGPIIGRIREFNIPGTVTLKNGEILEFKGFLDSHFSLLDIPHDCIMISPGLLYGKASS